MVTYRNLLEYRKQNELQISGFRTLGCIDSSTALSSGNHRVYLHFSIEGKKYHVSKEVKTEVRPGDSLPVYYLRRNPNINGIAFE
jgi:hypothetical protein